MDAKIKLGLILTLFIGIVIGFVLLFSLEIMVAGSFQHVIDNVNITVQLNTTKITDAINQTRHP